MMPRPQQIDITKSCETVADLLRRLGALTRPVDLISGGRVVARMVPVGKRYVDATPTEREKAWKDVQKIRRKVGKAMTEQGVTEEDVIRELVKDD